MIRKASFAIYTLGALLLVSVVMNILLWRSWMTSIELSEGEHLNNAIWRAEKYTDLQRQIREADFQKIEHSILSLVASDIRRLATLKNRARSAHLSASAARALGELDRAWTWEQPAGQPLRSLLDINSNDPGVVRVTATVNHSADTHTKEPHQ